MLHCLFLEKSSLDFMVFKLNKPKEKKKTNKDLLALTLFFVEIHLYFIS